MLTELGNELKKVLLAGIGAVALTAEKSEEVIKELVKRGELTVEQGKVLNEELKHKIKGAVDEKRAEFLDASMAMKLETMSREEREELKRKLAELDGQDQDDRATEGE